MLDFCFWGNVTVTVLLYLICMVALVRLIWGRQGVDEVTLVREEEKVGIFDDLLRCNPATNQALISVLEAEAKLPRPKMIFRYRRQGRRGCTPPKLNSL